MVNVTSTTLDKVMNTVGSPITINIGSETSDDYGTGSLSFTGSVATGYVQVLSESDDSVREGVLDVGDAVGFFKVDASFPIGSKIEIEHQGITFETIGEQVVPHIYGNQLMKQINLRRKVPGET